MRSVYRSSDPCVDGVDANRRSFNHASAIAKWKWSSKWTAMSTFASSRTASVVIDDRGDFFGGDRPADADYCEPCVLADAYGRDRMESGS